MLELIFFSSFLTLGSAFFAWTLQATFLCRKKGDQLWCSYWLMERFIAALQIEALISIPVMHSIQRI